MSQFIRLGFFIIAYGSVCSDTPKVKALQPVNCRQCLQERFAKTWIPIAFKSQYATRGVVNEETGKLFDLSKVDIKILACAISYGHKVASGDNGLKQFAHQEFSDLYKGDISPLGIINMWLRKGIITWNDEKQTYLAEWALLNEDPQPLLQRRQFKRLTGYAYPGS